MAYETVTGYCWPQSVEGGDVVGLHLSAARGRPVSVEVARVGAERTVVHVEHDVPADHHPTPPDAATDGCGWPVAMELTVDPSWRSGYYEVLLEIEVDGKRRQSHAFFVVRPRAGQPTARVLLALSTNTWHAYNDLGGRNLYTGATQVSLQRPMARGYLHKPPGLGRRVTTTAPPAHRLGAHLRGVRLPPAARLARATAQRRAPDDDGRAAGGRPPPPRPHRPAPGADASDGPRRARQLRLSGGPGPRRERSSGPTASTT